MIIIKQPLLHFLILGGLLFGLYAWIGDNEDSISAKQEIVITPGRVETLSANFKKVWQRDPSSEELEGLVREFIREEIYYREALAIGLDRDDTIIRRRLRQKMEFITADLSDQIEATEAELNDYYQENAEAYQISPEFSFQQVYLDPNKRQATLQADIENTLATLRASSEETILDEWGDRLMLESKYESTPQFDIERLFGKEFAAAMNTEQTGTWQGPIQSGYGLHLVKINERTKSRLPKLEDSREIVIRDWQSAKRRETNDKFFESLKERYTITIPQPENEGANQAGLGTVK